MKCLACYNWATAEMIPKIIVKMNEKEYLVYVCNNCGNEAYTPYAPWTPWIYEGTKEVQSGQQARIHTQKSVRPDRNG